MTTRFIILINPLSNSRLQLLCALALVLVGGICAPGVHDVSAKAPPLSTIVLDAEALTEPGYDAAAVAVIPQGTEAELTGEAEPGFLAVYYDGEAVWVPAQDLSLGDRPGIHTAVPAVDAPLLGALGPDTSLPEVILKGQAVILTGVTVDGNDPAVHGGKRNWIDERDLSR